jgi:hypothetical protein
MPALLHRGDHNGLARAVHPAPGLARIQGPPRYQVALPTLAPVPAEVQVPNLSSMSRPWASFRARYLSLHCSMQAVLEHCCCSTLLTLYAGIRMRGVLHPRSHEANVL